MHWIVDQIPDQSLLNTAGWRFIIPQLYKKYPNHRMNLNISLSSPPVVEISNQKAGVHVFADLTIDVLEENEVIPVACISLVGPLRFYQLQKSSCLYTLCNKLSFLVDLLP